MRAGLDRAAEDAGLLTTELAANAVLHARTTFDVVVHQLQDGARVEVRDLSDALPVTTAPSATAMSGRGLLLVATLATAWGAQDLPGGGKSVWFELARTPTATDPDLDLSVEDLLAAWAEDDPAPPAPDQHQPTSSSTGDVAVITVTVASARELLAAKEHLDDLLRELQLVLLDASDDDRHQATSPPPTADARAPARRLDTSARAFDAVRRQVREQVSRAVAAGTEDLTLHLQTSPGDADAARAYRSALEAAELLALGGDLLLTTADLSRHTTARRAYLDDLIAQLDHP